MARRGENIYKRKDGRWEGRYKRGRKPDGKTDFGSVYGHTYGEVKTKLLPLKALYSGASRERRHTGPFREYLLARLAKQRASSIKDSSYGSYYRIVHNHLLLGLGIYPTYQLTQQHVEDFLENLRRTGQSEGSIRNIFRYLAGVTKEAAQSGAMAKDICAEIKLPKQKRKKVKALTRAQQGIVEKAAMAVVLSSGFKKGLDILIALNTGLRLGEICALDLDEDFDLELGVFHISRTLQRLNLYDDEKSKTAIVTGPPKSESSERDVPINPFLLYLLRERRKHAKSKFVIEGRGGKPVEPRVLQYRFEKLLKRAGIPHVGYHSLRHTFATRCAEENVDVLCQLERADDMPFLRLGELGNHKDYRGQQALGGFIEETVGPHVRGVADDGVGDNFGVHLCFGLRRHIGGVTLPGVYIVVDEVQHIEAVAAHGLAQVQHRDPVAITLLPNFAVPAGEVALRIANEKRHAGCQGELDVRQQKESRLAAAGRADHEGMNIAFVHDGGGLFEARALAHDDALAIGQIFVFLWGKQLAVT